MRYLIELRVVRNLLGKDSEVLIELRVFKFVRRSIRLS